MGVCIFKWGVQFNVSNLAYIFELFGTFCNPVCGHVLLWKSIDVLLSEKQSYGMQEVKEATTSSLQSLIDELDE